MTNEERLAEIKKRVAEEWRFDPKHCYDGQWQDMAWLIERLEEMEKVLRASCRLIAKLLGDVEFLHLLKE